MTPAARVTILGLARAEDVFDAVVEGDEMVLARIGARLRDRGGLAGLALLALTWVSVVYAKVGVKRLPGATGHGLAGEDEAPARERLRLQGLRLDEIARRDRRNVRLRIAGLTLRVIEGDETPLVEITGDALKAPLVLEAAGDPPRRLADALRGRGARID